MKKIMALIVSCASMCVAMEQPNNEMVQTIKAMLALDLNAGGIMYSLIHQKDLIAKFNLNMKASDPVVKVIIYGKRDDRILKNIKALPLSMLRDKNDGDKLAITVDERKSIILICGQEIFTGERFKNRLEAMIEAFKDYPNYVRNDKEELLNRGIIVLNELDREFHGPNGYKFER